MLGYNAFGLILEKPSYADRFTYVASATGSRSIQQAAPAEDADHHVGSALRLIFKSANLGIAIGNGLRLGHFETARYEAAARCKGVLSWFESDFYRAVVFRGLPV